MMSTYIVRRLLLMIPTLFAIMVINFAIIQVAPGGPVEQIISQLTGVGTDMTDRWWFDEERVRALEAHRQ